MLSVPYDHVGMYGFFCGVFIIVCGLINLVQALMRLSMTCTEILIGFNLILSLRLGCVVVMGFNDIYLMTYTRNLIEFTIVCYVEVKVFLFRIT